MHVLDVGSGSGYLTAVFALMVGETGRTVGVEHIPELVDRSIDAIKRGPAGYLLDKGLVEIHVFTPMSKYGLAVAVAGDQIDSFLPFPPHSRTYLTLSTVIRTLIAFSILAVAITLPFFHDMLALCGAVFAMTMTITLPAACNLKMFGRSLSPAEIVCSIVCILVGIFFTIIGAESSLRALMDRLSS